MSPDLNHVLPDVLAHGLDVVFCGTAAGAKSAQAGAYYAGPGNKFWQTLHTVGLTPRRLLPVQFRELLEYRLGLTDLAKFTAGPDASLQRADFGVTSLQALLLEYRPRIVAFTSKRAAAEFFGHSVAYGLAARQFAGISMFTLTSPSGLATRYWESGTHWLALAELVRALRD